MTLPVKHLDVVHELLIKLLSDHLWKGRVIQPRLPYVRRLCRPASSLEEVYEFGFAVQHSLDEHATIKGTMGTRQRMSQRCVLPRDTC